MAERMLVMPRSLTADPHPAVERLRNDGHELLYARPGAMLGEEELIRLLAGCVGWLAGVGPESARIVENASAPRVISRNGAGVDNLPLDALAGIRRLREVGSGSRGRWNAASESGSNVSGRYHEMYKSHVRKFHSDRSIQRCW
jgi:D-3-phosphoglycerate dehydrogenase